VNLSRIALPDAPPRLCHRLDRETSGIVVMAKDLESQRRIMRQFEDRKVRKSYLALVWGRPDPPRGTIDIPLRLSRVSKIRMKMETVLESDHGSGLPSTTSYDTRESSNRFSLVSCMPETGRQHQIRIHMAHAGHPLVGDKIYGVDEDLFLEFIETGLSDDMLHRLLLPRHALHAASISLRHPATDEELFVESPLAEDIRTLFEGDR
jgi:23S rRNA pseudouridine1911/1915/1917 synthase